MSRIFISHSSSNNAEAIAVRDWMASQGWDDVFLDLDAERGLKAGERWQEALKKAAERCEFVLFLVSPQWAQSKWCLAEFLLAKSLNKRILAAIVSPTALADLPAEMIAEWQIVDLVSGERDHVTTVAPPPGFAQQSVALATKGLKRLRLGLLHAGLDPKYFEWPPAGDPGRAPYRGLKPYEAEDAGIFFGREAPIIRALDQLRGLRETAPPRLFVILGASGAGKSSFLRAGLLPRMMREDAAFLPLPVVRPQRAALYGDTGLLRSLELAADKAKIKIARADLRGLLTSDPSRVLTLLVEIADRLSPPLTPHSTLRPTPALVLPIDQAEELFLAEAHDEAQKLIHLLVAFARSESPPILPLLTIRSDNFEHFQHSGELGQLNKHTFDLGPMPRGSYAEVVKAPIHRLEGTPRTLKIEESLVDALLADVEAGGAKDALPLLAFALERLYSEYGSSGKLELTHYVALGGIKGAIEAAVSHAFKAADSNPAIPSGHAERLRLLRHGLIPWLAGLDADTGAPGAGLRG